MALILFICQQSTVLGWVLGAYNHNEFPVNPGEGGMVSQDHLIAGTDDRKFDGGTALLVILHNLILEDGLALLGCAVVQCEGDRGSPLLELILPIGECAERRNNEMGSIKGFLFAK
jgi:hypothetical protein